MNDYDKLETMFKLQEKLNIETNGEDWLDGVTDEGRNINWFTCIVLETSELMESYNWKHWKDINGETDEDNVDVELADIWHFFMSLLMELNNGSVYNSARLVNVILTAMKDAEQPTDDVNLEGMFSLYKAFISTVINLETLVSNITDEKDAEGVRDTVSYMVLLFLMMLESNDMSISLLYDKYIVKNLLNRFRQEHGYKDGLYKKHWTVGEFKDEEDNKVVFHYVNRLIDKTPDAIYKEIEGLYSTSLDNLKRSE